MIFRLHLESLLVYWEVNLVANLFAWMRYKVLGASFLVYGGRQMEIKWNCSILHWRCAHWYAEHYLQGIYIGGASKLPWVKEPLCSVFRDCPEKSGCFATSGVPIALLVSEILPPYLIKRPSLNASVSLRMIEVWVTDGPTYSPGSVPEMLSRI